jgi:hypothetical protein
MELEIIMLNEESLIKKENDICIHIYTYICKNMTVIEGLSVGVGRRKKNDGDMLKYIMSMLEGGSRKLTENC